MKKEINSNEIFEIIKDVKYKILESQLNYNLIPKNLIGEFDMKNFDKIKSVLNYLNKKSFIFITAFNPYGENRDNKVNIDSNDKLLNEFKDYIYLDVTTVFNGKEDELGYVVFDFPFDMAIILMNKYEQNAIIFGNLKEIKLLINE